MKTKKLFYGMLVAVMLMAGLFIVSPPGVYAGGPGTSAATFLNIGVGGRAAAMAGAYSAVADDATALYWNPAATERLLQQEVVAMHALWLADTSYDFIGYVYPMKDFNLGVAATMLSYGSIPLTLNWADSLSWVNPNDPGAAGGSKRSFTANSNSEFVSMSRKVGEFMLGANLKFIQESIYNQSASAFAADLGGLYSFKETGLDLALTVRNIGTNMRFSGSTVSDPLPLEVRIGSAYDRLLKSKKLLLALDISQPNDNNASVLLGTEYKLIDLLAFRAGYQYKLGGNDIQGTGVTAGFGINYQDTLNLDYAFVPFGELGDTHRISISFRFGKSKSPIFEPEAGLLRAKIADLEEQLKNSTASSQQYDTLLKEKDKNEKIYIKYLTGMELYQKKQYDEAIAQFQELAELDTDRKASIQELIEKIKNENAISVQNEQPIVEKQPSEAEIKQEIKYHNDRGMDYYDSGDYLSAKTEFQKIIDLAPDNSQALKYKNECIKKLNAMADDSYKKGVQEYFTGDLEKSIDSFNLALKYNPSHELAQVSLEKVQRELKAKK